VLTEGEGRRTWRPTAGREGEERPAGRGRRGRRLGREAGGWEKPLAAGCRGEKNRDLNLD
jgi:hypothetical protein